jgi:hypothetical protein
MRVLIAVCCFGFVGSVQAESEPKLVKSKAGGYSVMASNKPTTETKNVDSSIGPIKVTTDAYSYINGVSMSVTYTDYPEPFATVDGAKLLDRVREAMMKEAIPLEKPTIEPLDGKRYSLEFSAKMTNSLNMRCRLYWIGTRLYQVTVIGTPKALTENRVAAFVEKFVVND